MLVPPRSLGKIPFDCQSPKVELFQTWISPTKSDKIAKVREKNQPEFIIQPKSSVCKSCIIFAIWACLEDEINVRNLRKLFW